MSPYLQLLTLLTTALRSRIDQARARGDDAGVSTLEMVVIGLGLFLVATAVVAIITNAIMSRANQIN